ncbi:MAG: tetratricopeptide repeat protein [Pseudomonadota bacterium]|nr:tetratricopeptide repeat protein [Pseudomonadota bacterium]
MSTSPDAARARALFHLRSGRPHEAIEAFCESLALDPDDAPTHAWLALALLSARRLGAARIEAELAVGIAADAPLPLYALGRVHLAERRYKDAEATFRALLAIEPDDDANHRALAEVYIARARWADALAALEKARALDPTSADTLADIAEVHLRLGRLREAESTAREALEASPEHAGALVVMGWLLLRRGEAAEAREHAVTVLRIQPLHEGATALLVGVKARSSRVLGVWWRYNTWLAGLGPRAITVMLGGFAAYQILSFLAADFGPAGLADLLQVVWLGFVAYTWFGPAMFRRTLEKELAPVTLRGDF